MPRTAAGEPTPDSGFPPVPTAPFELNPGPAPSVWLVRDRRYETGPRKVFSWFWFAGEKRGDRPGMGAYAGFPWDEAEVYGPYMAIALAETAAGRMGGEFVRLTGVLAGVLGGKHSATGLQRSIDTSEENPGG